MARPDTTDIAMEIRQFILEKIPNCRPKNYSKILSTLIGVMMWDYVNRTKIRYEDAFNMVFVELCESLMWCGHLSAFWKDEFFKQINKLHNEKRANPC